jgi:hypothetical protein
VHQCPDVWRPDDRLAVQRPQAGRSNAKDLRDDTVSIEGKRRAQGLRLQLRLVVHVAPEADHLVRGAIIGFEGDPFKRPSTMSHPGTGLKVDAVQRAAPAAPMVRGATKAAESGISKRKIRASDVLTVTEILYS